MKVGFIGGGNMGEAMIAALCRAGGRDCAAGGENFTEDKKIARRAEKIARTTGKILCQILKALRLAGGIPQI